MSESTDGPDFIALHDRDTVATALWSLPAGHAARVQAADGGHREVVLLEAIALGHKVALAAINKGDLVLKHGYPMGRATADIAKGAHVHVHNVISLSRERGNTFSGAHETVEGPRG